MYEQREHRAYAYKLARQIISSATPIDGMTEVEAVDLLLRIWNRGASQTKLLSLARLDTLLAITADARAAFEDRHITSLRDAEQSEVEGIYGGFRESLGPVGAATALGLLHPRFFPLWDSKIASHYVGASFRQSDRSYVDFMHCCAEQRSVGVSEREFGEWLLKTLDEWNYCIWTQGWIPAPGR